MQRSPRRRKWRRIERGGGEAGGGEGAGGRVRGGRIGVGGRGNGGRPCEPHHGHPGTIDGNGLPPGFGGAYRSEDKNMEEHENEGDDLSTACVFFHQPGEAAIDGVGATRSQRALRAARVQHGPQVSACDVSHACDAVEFAERKQDEEEEEAYDKEDEEEDEEEDENK